MKNPPNPCSEGAARWRRGEGRTYKAHARLWRAFVMIPDCEPVNDTAWTPRSSIAIESSAVEMRSPTESNMSSSRVFGFSEIPLARPRSSSVVPPMALTTATTRLPERTVSTIRERRADLVRRRERKNKLLRMRHGQVPVEAADKLAKRR